MIVYENEYLFLDGSIVEPIAYQDNDSGICFFETKVPVAFWDSDVEVGKLRQEAQEWAVETACLHFGLDQKEYFISACPWEERLSVALIPLNLVPNHVMSGLDNYWYDFVREAWTKIN